jgi:steroid delta-isomerase-like uncharacterized protein
MSIDIQKITLDMGEAWFTHDTQKLLSYYADDSIYEDVPLNLVKKGKEEIANFIDDFFTAFPDIKGEVKSVFFSADRACVEAIMTGTHSDNSFPPDLPATGRVVSSRIVSIEEFRQDKVVRHADYYDLYAFLRQLGVLPESKWMG